MIVYSVVLCVCCRSVLLGVLVDGHLCMSARVWSVCLHHLYLWCHVVVFLGAMYMLAMVMSLKCFVCILRSCISVLSVLMTCGVLMCVHVVSDLMYVMRRPPCLCSLSVRMAVKCGVLNAEVSFDSGFVMMSGCVVCMRCLSSSTMLLVICVELKYFYFFVFCFGGILYVSCVTVCGCGWWSGDGELKSWDGWCWGGGGVWMFV